MERTRIVSPGQLKATSSSRMSHSWAPKTKTKKMSSGSSGTLLTTSAARWMTQVHAPALVAGEQPQAGADGRAHGRGGDADEERHGQPEGETLGQVAAARRPCPSRP